MMIYSMVGPIIYIVKYSYETIALICLKHYKVLIHDTLLLWCFYLECHIMC